MLGTIEYCFKLKVGAKTPTLKLFAEKVYRVQTVLDSYWLSPISEFVFSKHTKADASPCIR